jgi:hypothetical protein
MLWRGWALAGAVALFAVAARYLDVSLHIAVVPFEKGVGWKDGKVDYNVHTAHRLTLLEGDTDSIDVAFVAMCTSTLLVWLPLASASSRRCGLCACSTSGCARVERHHGFRQGPQHDGGGRAAVGVGGGCRPRR